MKKAIIRDLLFDAIIMMAITEGILAAVWYCDNYLFETSAIKSTYYIIAAVLIAAGLTSFYALNFLLCIKKYNTVMRNQNISDSTYYQYYRSANKCCNYRVYKNFVFVNTTRGIVCMEKRDIIDKKTRRVKHTKSTRRITRYGGTRSVYHAREYYTYHFRLVTTHGSFKNTVGNADVLSDLQDLFA